MRRSWVGVRISGLLLRVLELFVHVFRGFSGIFGDFRNFLLFRCFVSIERVLGVSNSFSKIERQSDSGSVGIVSSDPTEKTGDRKYRGLSRIQAESSETVPGR